MCDNSPVKTIEFTTMANCVMIGIALQRDLNRIGLGISSFTFAPRPIRIQI